MIPSNSSYSHFQYLWRTLDPVPVVWLNSAPGDLHAVPSSKRISYILIRDRNAARNTSAIVLGSSTVLADVLTVIRVSRTGHPVVGALRLIRFVRVGSCAVIFAGVDDLTVVVLAMPGSLLSGRCNPIVGEISPRPPGCANRCGGHPRRGAGRADRDGPTGVGRGRDHLVDLTGSSTLKQPAA